MALGRRAIEGLYGRLVRRLVILIILVLAVLVGADRLSVYIAERAVASAIQSSQHLPDTPSVSIKGFPFLTQLARNRYDKVELSADNATISNGGKTLTIEALQVTLQNLVTTRTFSHASVGAAEGSATLSYASLSTLLGSKISYGGTSADGNGRIKATQTVTVLGQRISGSVTAEVGLTAANTIGFSGVTVLGIDVPQLVVRSLQTVFAHSLALKGFPVGLQLTRVAAGPTSVTLYLSGRNVRIK